MDGLGKQCLNPGDFLILALAVGPIKCCSAIVELRWWLEPFFTYDFAVATPMLGAIRKSIDLSPKSELGEAKYFFLWKTTDAMLIIIKRR